MVIVSRGVIRDKREFGSKYGDFDAFQPVLPPDIRSSILLAF
jgi:hypothetical protein